LSLESDEPCKVLAGRLRLSRAALLSGGPPFQPAAEIAHSGRATQLPERQVGMTL